MQCFAVMTASRGLFYLLLQSSYSVSIAETMLTIHWIFLACSLFQKWPCTLMLPADIYEVGTIVTLYLLVLAVLSEGHGLVHSLLKSFWQAPAT